MTLARPSAANDESIVRLATPFDQSHLQAVFEAAQTAGMSAFDGSLQEALLRNRVYLTYVGETPVGCIMATNASCTVLHALTVIPQQRGKGHASNLIHAAIESIESLGGVNSFWTAVDPTLAGAEERFRKHGFEDALDVPYRTYRLMTRQAVDVVGARRIQTVSRPTSASRPSGRPIPAASSAHL